VPIEYVEDGEHVAADRTRLEPSTPLSGPPAPRTLGDDPQACIEEFRRRWEDRAATPQPVEELVDDEIPREPSRDLKWDVRCSASEREAWTRAASSRASPSPTSFAERRTER
jgi:hypothetical protein